MSLMMASEAVNKINAIIEEYGDIPIIFLIHGVKGPHNKTMYPIRSIAEIYVCDKNNEFDKEIAVMLSNGIIAERDTKNNEEE